MASLLFEKNSKEQKELITMFSIRRTDLEDSQAVCRIVRKSIIETCVKDHKQDEVVQEEWLKNKTPDNFKNWISAKDNLSLVAVDDTDKPIGFILAKLAMPKAELLLNYIASNHTGRGVGYGLYNELEQALMRRGIDEIITHSTQTAREFYSRMGFSLIGWAADPSGWQAEIPMKKGLTYK